MTLESLMNMLLVYVDVHDYEYVKYEVVWNVDIAYGCLLGLHDYMGLCGFT